MSDYLRMKQQAARGQNKVVLESEDDVWTNEDVEKLLKYNEDDNYVIRCRISKYDVGDILILSEEDWTYDEAKPDELKYFFVVPPEDWHNPHFFEDYKKSDFTVHKLSPVEWDV